MVFEIIYYPPFEDLLDAEWRWQLRRGTGEHPGNVIAAGGGAFYSEREARQAVAEAKKAMSAVRYAKTVKTMYSYVYSLAKTRQLKRSYRDRAQFWSKNAFKFDLLFCTETNS